VDAPLPGLDVEDFLANRWQRKPCLIRGALANFDWPLDANDLAGLACEDQVEARIITGPDDHGAWTLEHGPFDEDRFETIGNERWTLLVQDVEKHYPPLARLLEHFRFLPSWRIDDLMLSFAAPGGSVGPHVDQYDVFLCQVEGRRRWEIAERFDPARREDVPVDMLASFQAEQSWDLESGDILYLPPGVAHHGVALDPCVTCSVGFRAPSAADLALGLGEWLADRTGDGGRYRDPMLAAAPATGEIDSAALERFRTLLASTLEQDEALAGFIGQFMSRYRQAHEPLPIPGEDGRAALESALLEAHSTTTDWITHPWARFAWVRANDDTARLFASGREYACTPGFAEWVCRGAGAIDAPAGVDRTCLTALARNGHLIPAGD
jgi:50S ribosomal protein L16 3-hydroxylase